MIGIYKILNLKTNKCYVGSSRNIEGRWYTHKSKLRNSAHPNRKLQKAFDKFGEENLLFEVLDVK